MDPAVAVPRRKGVLAGSRYELLVKIASGGTATVYVGRLSASEGFRRLVAIKRAHPYLRDDPKARGMLVQEAQLASQLHHANVVPVHDVEQSEDELLLIMDYVEGGSLADLLERASDSGEVIPPRIALRIVLDACAGLRAVHALRGEEGRALGLVHRDVSPQNILVGIDGTARLTDFGLAKVTEVSNSSTATVRGKIAYMAPEYIEGRRYTQRCDIFSMAVVVWESLTSRRLFRGSNDADTLRRVVSNDPPQLSTVLDGVGEGFDAIVDEALHKDPERRTTSIDRFAQDLAAAAGRRDLVASHAEVGRYVDRAIGDVLGQRREVVRRCTADLFGVSDGVVDGPGRRAPGQPTVTLVGRVPRAAEPKPEEEETLRQPVVARSLEPTRDIRGASSEPVSISSVPPPISSVPAPISSAPLSTPPWQSETSSTSIAPRSMSRRRWLPAAAVLIGALLLWWASDRGTPPASDAAPSSVPPAAPPAPVTAAAVEAEIELVGEAAAPSASASASSHPPAPPAGKRTRRPATSTTADPGLGVRKPPWEVPDNPYRRRRNKE